MLSHLKIKSLGVIEEANIEFQSGFNVITGETGTGKTMLLTALGLALGSRSDVELIRQNDDRLAVAVTFEATSAAVQISDEMDIQADDEIILGRSITKDGKSKAVINGSPATATQLQTIGSSLLTIHAQNSSTSIRRLSSQRDRLDEFGKEEIFQIKQQLAESYQDVKSSLDQLAEFSSKSKNWQTRLGELEEIVSKAKSLAIAPSELLEIEEELKKLNSVDQLATPINQVVRTFEDGLIGTQTLRSLASLEDADSEVVELVSILENYKVQQEEVLDRFKNYANTLAFDPNRLEFLQERKAEIKRTLRRFDCEDIVHFLKMAEEARFELEQVINHDEVLQKAQQDLDRNFRRYNELAEQLHQRRSSAAQRLSTLVTEEIRKLSMPKANFQVSVQLVDINSPSEVRVEGLDEIDFLFAATPATQLIAISKGASGGELSRILLSLELVIASPDSELVYIFDEVDSGVGGATAIEVGRRLAQLGKTNQVIVVTHLAQVAAFADAHFYIKKDELSRAQVDQLPPDERVIELARMLGGMASSTSARAHAKELMELAQSAS